MRPVFIGELTTDVVIYVHGKGDSEPLRRFERFHLGGDDWAEYVSSVVSLSDFEVMPGGSIANVAAAYSRFAGPRGGSEATFSCVAQASTSELRRPFWWPGYDLSAGDLRRRLIRVRGLDLTEERPATPGAIAKVGSDGRVRNLTVNAQVARPVSLVPGDLLVLRSDHLTLLPSDYVKSFSHLALMLADDDSRFEQTIRILGSAHNSWVFGRHDQAAALLDALEHSLPEGMTLVGTAGAGPCTVWTAESRLPLPVDPIDIGGSDLGAGDAYFGAFLAASIQAVSAQRAHAAGVHAAVEVLCVKGARPAPAENLNHVFPHTMNRVSDATDEGKIFDYIRKSPGVAVVTGGQTGIEWLAASAASRSGLPVHLVMPKGLRRETGDLTALDIAEMERVRFHELGSRSFRFRTWASVYVADSVLLVDLEGGEGSQETRDAAQELNRPLYELGRGGASQAKIRGWLQETGARSVLVAGSRESLLRSSGRYDTARVLVEETIAGVGATNAERLMPRAAGLATFGLEGRVGCPARVAPWLRRFAERENLGGVEPVLLPARDVLSAVQHGLVALGLTWPSLIPPDVIGEYEVVPLGVFPVHYGFAPRIDSRAIRTVAVQYPFAYSRKFICEDDDIRTIMVAGSAEEWLAAHVVEATYDSYRTGATAARYGLGSFYPSHWETLSVIGRRRP